MSTIIEIMLAIKERLPVYYHKDTKQFDRLPYSKAENLNPNAMISGYGAEKYIFSAITVMCYMPIYLSCCQCKVF